MKLSLFLLAVAALIMAQAAAVATPDPPSASPIPSTQQQPQQRPPPQPQQQSNDAEGTLVVVPPPTDYEAIKAFVNASLNKISSNLADFNTTLQTYIDRPAITQVPVASGQAVLSAINATAETLSMKWYSHVFFDAEQSLFVDTKFHEIYTTVSVMAGVLRANIRVVNGKEGARAWLASFLPATEVAFTNLADSLKSYIRSEKFTGTMKRTHVMIDQEIFDTIQAYNFTAGGESEMPGEAEDVDRVDSDEVPKVDKAGTTSSEAEGSAEHLTDSLSRMKTLLRIEKYIEETRYNVTLALDRLQSLVRESLLDNTTETVLSTRGW